jgi:dihydropteroate synthase
MDFCEEHKTMIMGIVNVTPDSFYDGGTHMSADSAFDHAMKLLGEGADILDIGGESSRPGAAPVTEQEELDRVCPVVERIHAAAPDAVISVDTYKSRVADESLARGASMINDISGLSADSRMASVCASRDAWIVIMHMKGDPLTMQRDTKYTDCIGEIESFLLDAAARAVEAGIARGKIILDPGIGFGKSLEQNYRIIHNIPRFKAAGFPVLIGLSRKSLIGALLPDGEDRLPATLALDGVCSVSGADIVRVHDVKAHALALRAIDMLRKVPA